MRAETNRKRASSNSTSYLVRTRLCPVMLRCDGATLPRGREVCKACEREQLRRQGASR